MNLTTKAEELRALYASRKGETVPKEQVLTPTIEVHATDSDNDIEPETETVEPEVVTPEVKDAKISTEATKIKTVKIAGIDLVVRQDLSPDDLKFVPGPSTYVDSQQVLKALAVSIRDDVPMLIVGETGVGKTSALRYIAWKTNTPYIRINLSGGTTCDELLGKFLINESGTYYVEGDMIRGMKGGYIVVLDETNMAHPDVLASLHSLLDDDKFIVLSQKDGEVVRPATGFRVFATMNPSDTYAGTKALNKAFAGRWILTKEVDYPTAAQERRIIKSQVPDLTVLDDKDVENMINLSREIRKSYKKGACEYAISPRDLISWVKMSETFGDLNEASEVTFMPKAPEEERQGLRDLIKLRFGLGLHDYIPNCKVGETYAEGDKVVVLSRLKENGHEFVLSPKDLEASDVCVHLLEVKSVTVKDYQDQALQLKDYTYEYKVTDSSCDKTSDEMKSWSTNSMALGQCATSKYHGIK